MDPATQPIFADSDQPLYNRNRSSPRTSRWYVVTLALCAVGAALYFGWRDWLAVSTTTPPVTSLQPAASASTVNSPVLPAPPITALPRYPLPAANLAALPPLAESDAPVGDALRLNLGAGEIAELLNSTDIVWRIVATVDSLPRRQITPRLLPVRSPRGSFLTREDHGELTIDAANEHRYDVYGALAEHLNIRRVVEAYVSFYPLFQEEYRLLGHPDGAFNDRLIVVIDDLLSTPSPERPIAVACRKVLCEFQDPDLEDLSAGQKILLRMGAANAAIVKAKLLQLRHEVIAIGQQH